jgi:hypothetical protein
MGLLVTIRTSPVRPPGKNVARNRGLSAVAGPMVGEGGHAEQGLRLCSAVESATVAPNPPASAGSLNWWLSGLRRNAADDPNGDQAIVQPQPVGLWLCHTFPIVPTKSRIGARLSSA